MFKGTFFILVSFIFSLTALALTLFITFNIDKQKPVTVVVQKEVSKVEAPVVSATPSAKPVIKTVAPSTIKETVVSPVAQ